MAIDNEGEGNNERSRFGGAGMFRRTEEQEWTRFSRALSGGRDPEETTHTPETSPPPIWNEAASEVTSLQNQQDSDDFNTRIEAGIKLHGVGASADSQTRDQIQDAHYEENRPPLRGLGLIWEDRTKKPTLAGKDPSDEYTDVGGNAGNEGIERAFETDVAERGLVQTEPADLSVQNNLERPDLEMNPINTPYDSIDNPTYDRKRDRYYGSRASAEFPEPPALQAEIPRAVEPDPRDQEILEQTAAADNEVHTPLVDEHPGRNAHRRTGGAGMIFSGARNAIRGAAQAVGDEFKRLTAQDGNSRLEETSMPDNLPPAEPIANNPYGLSTPADRLQPIPNSAPIQPEPAPPQPQARPERTPRQTHNLNPQPGFFTKLFANSDALNDDPVGIHTANELSREPETTRPEQTPASTSEPETEEGLNVAPAGPNTAQVIDNLRTAAQEADEDLNLPSVPTPRVTPTGPSPVGTEPPGEDENEESTPTAPIVQSAQPDSRRRDRREAWKNMSAFEKTKGRINLIKRRLNEQADQVKKDLESGSKTVLGSAVPDLLAGAFAGATVDQITKNSKVMQNGLISMSTRLASGALAGGASAGSREIVQIYERERADLQNLQQALSRTIHQAVLNPDTRRKVLRGIGRGSVLGLIGAYAGDLVAKNLLEEAKKRARR